MENGSNLENVVREGIKSNSDVGIDLVEATIDIFIEGTFKDLPIIKTIMAFYKGALGVREAHLIKKLIMFFDQLHSGILSESDLQAFLNKFEEDAAYRQKVTNHIMILNDRFIEEQKSIYFANLLAAHVKGYIAYDEYFEISLIIENSQLKVFEMLSEFATYPEPFKEIQDGSVFAQKPYSSLLLSSGLVISSNGNFGVATVNFYGVCIYYYAMQGKLDISRAEIEFAVPPTWTPSS